MNSSVTAVQGLTIGFLLIFLLTSKPEFVWIALLVLFIQQVSPKLTISIGSVLHHVLRQLGSALVFLVLTLLYLLFVTPYAFIYRFFHKNETKLFLGLSNNRDTYFTTSDREYNRNFFEKPW